MQASVFQVARAPGKNIVYLGCALLILGVFAMLYIRERRVWVWLSPQEQGSHALMALSTNRKTMDGDKRICPARSETDRRRSHHQEPPHEHRKATTITLNEGFLSRRNWLDWLFAVAGRWWAGCTPSSATAPTWTCMKRGS